MKQVAVLVEGQTEEVVVNNVLRDAAPSKRLEAADPRYMKTVTGPLLIAEAGLGAILARCTTFRAWWEDLLA